MRGRGRPPSVVLLGLLLVTGLPSPALAARSVACEVRACARRASCGCPCQACCHRDAPQRPAPTGEDDCPLCRPSSQRPDAAPATEIQPPPEPALSALAAGTPPSPGARARDVTRAVEEVRRPPRDGPTGAVVLVL